MRTRGRDPLAPGSIEENAAARARIPSTESAPTDSEHRPASRPESLGPRPDRHHRVGDEQVLEPRVREDLGLADRRDREPDRSCGDLPSSERNALVRLRVRPQGDAPFAHDGGHLLDPRIGAVEVNDDVRGVDRRRRPLDRVARRSSPPPGTPRGDCGAALSRIPSPGSRHLVRGKIPPGTHRQGDRRSQRRTRPLRPGATDHTAREWQDGGEA